MLCRKYKNLSMRLLGQNDKVETKDTDVLYDGLASQLRYLQVFLTLLDGK
jgi:hypothetical protein